MPSGKGGTLEESSSPTCYRLWTSWISRRGHHTTSWFSLSPKPRTSLRIGNRQRLSALHSSPSLHETALRHPLPPPCCIRLLSLHDGFHSCIQFYLELCNLSSVFLNMLIHFLDSFASLNNLALAIIVFFLEMFGCVEGLLHAEQHLYVGLSNHENNS